MENFPDGKKLLPKSKSSQDSTQLREAAPFLPTEKDGRSFPRGDSLQVQEELEKAWISWIVQNNFEYFVTIQGNSPYGLSRSAQTRLLAYFRDKTDRYCLSYRRYKLPASEKTFCIGIAETSIRGIVNHVHLLVRLPPLFYTKIQDYPEFKKPGARLLSSAITRLMNKTSVLPYGDVKFQSLKQNGSEDSEDVQDSGDKDSPGSGDVNLNLNLNTRSVISYMLKQQKRLPVSERYNWLF